MKFYRVEFTMTAIVQAEDEGDAYSVADDAWRDIRSGSDPCISIGDEVRSLAELTDGWDGMCLPYGGDGNTRLQDLLPAAGEPAKEK